MQTDFRLYKKNGNKMVYPSDWDSDEGVFLGQDGKLYHLDDDGACGDPDCCGAATYYMHIYPYDVVVQFYTGKRDNADNKIFADDILEYFGMKKIVVWDDDKSCWALKRALDSAPKTFEQLGNINLEKSAVVGNIHQDAGLLE